MPSKKSSSKTSRTTRSRKSVAPAGKRKASFSPEMRRVVTLASVAAMRAFLEAWEKESPETMPEAMQLMHQVVSRHQLEA